MEHWQTGLHHKILLFLAIALTTLYSSVLLSMSVTSHIEGLVNLSIFSIIGFFVGPLFVCALGDYLFRKKSIIIRIAVGILTFCIFYAIESAIYTYQHGSLAQYGIYPRTILYSELLFYPAYIVISFTISASFLYNLLDSKRWRYLIAIPLCALVVLLNVIPIDILNTQLIFFGMALLSIGSALGLPNLHKNLIDTLGEVGHKMFFVVLLGYTATLCLTAQVQLIEIVSSDLEAYLILLDTNVHFLTMDHESRLTMLLVTNWLGKASLVLAALFLGIQMVNKNSSFYSHCQKLSKRVIQGILPGVLIILASVFVFEPWGEIQITNHTGDMYGTTLGGIEDGADYILIFTHPSEEDLIVIVCGENEHNADYSRREVSSIYGLESSSDQFTITRTALSEKPNLPYLDMLEPELQCSRLMLSQDQTWTSTANAINITNSSVSYLHIDSGQATNLNIMYEGDDQGSRDEKGAYSLCIWITLLPVMMLYFYSTRKSGTKLRLDASYEGHTNG